MERQMQEEGHVKKEAGIRVMLSQAKECLRANRCWERQEGSTPKDFRESTALPTS